MSYFPFELFDRSRPLMVFGRDGQVGLGLQAYLRSLKVPTVFMGRLDCDLSNASEVKGALNYYQPQVIINAAAYTSVDKAESERELAFAINAKAPAVMANYIANIANGVLVHYSTDYVFADSKQTPYLESDATGPIEKLSAYGQSKLAGEQAIHENFNKIHGSSKKSYLEKLSRYFILRTSWVYGEGDNFIRTMLRLATERDQLKVVADQVGVPSSAEWLARIGVQIACSRAQSGIYHAVPDGETSWHGLAVFVIKAGTSYSDGIEFKLKNILPIPAIAYPLAAPRPYNSLLNNSKLKKVLSLMAFKGQYPHWQEQVDNYIKNYIKESLRRYD